MFSWVLVLRQCMTIEVCMIVYHLHPSMYIVVRSCIKQIVSILSRHFESLVMNFIKQVAEGYIHHLF